MKNKESGVTLIVLVIAIIVVLLLAGITVNMASRQVGIFANKNTTIKTIETTPKTK